MKKALLTLGIALLSTFVFGQGKIYLENFSHPVYLTSDSFWLLIPDTGKAGQALPYGDSADPLPSGKLIMFGLYGGTSSTSLSFLTAVPVNNGTEFDNGIINTQNYTLPAGFPGGTPAFFQVKLWDAPYHAYEDQLAGGTKEYQGESPIFTVTPGASFPVSIDHGAGTTWAPERLQFWWAAPESSPPALVGLGAICHLPFAICYGAALR